MCIYGEDLIIMSVSECICSEVVAVFFVSAERFYHHFSVIGV